MGGLAIAVPLLIVLWAVVLGLMERRFPYIPGFPVLRPDFWTDLVGYTLVQSYVLGLVIAQIILTIDHATGASRWRMVGEWPMIAQLAFFIVLHDFWQYWFHRLQHRNRWFWRIHEAAHAPLHVDWLSGSRSHALEILVAQTFEYAPIILLGASPELPLWKGLCDAMWGMFNHSNIAVPHSRVLWLLNGPQLHRWHHDLDTPRGGVNLSTKLSLWDTLFKTRYLPPEAVRPGRYGLTQSDSFPHGSYLRQLVHPFRRFRSSTSERH